MVGNPQSIYDDTNTACIAAHGWCGSCGVRFVRSRHNAYSFSSTFAQGTLHDPYLTVAQNTYTSCKGRHYCLTRLVNIAGHVSVLVLNALAAVHTVWLCAYRSMELVIIHGRRPVRLRFQCLYA